MIGPTGTNILNTNENFMVAGGLGINDTMMYSYDGNSWIGLGNSIFDTFCQSIAFNGTQWIAIGESNNKLAVSADGINWRGLGNIIFNGGDPGVSFAHNGRLWVAVGGYSVTYPNTIAYSYDGINWVGLGNSIFGDVGRAIIWDGEKFIAGGGKTSSPTNTLAYSYDGINWIGLGTSTFNQYTWGLAYNGRTYVSVGSGGSFNIYYSLDGFNWTGTNTGDMMTNNYDVIWNGEKFIAVGKTSTPTIYNSIYSFDGITWSKANTGINFNSYSIAYNGTKWYQGDDNGTLRSSTNGTSWSTVSQSILDSAIRTITPRRINQFVNIGRTGSTGSTGPTGSTGWTGPTGTSGATILPTNNTFSGENTFSATGSYSGVNTFSNTISIQQIQEKIISLTGSSGTVNHDWSTGSIFIHSNISGNFTTNITNLPTNPLKAYVLTLVLVQGATGYYSNALQIGGSGQAISWINGSTPTPTSNKTEVQTFTLLNRSTSTTPSYTGTALGQFSTFG